MSSLGTEHGTALVSAGQRAELAFKALICWGSIKFMVCNWYLLVYTLSTYRLTFSIGIIFRLSGLFFLMLGPFHTVYSTR